MKFNYWKTFAFGLILNVAGCATTLEPGSEKVHVVTANQKEHSCVSLGLISTEQRVGPNKPSNAMNKALNEVVRKGGNGIFFISNNVDWAEGASVIAEALRCKY